MAADETQTQPVVPAQPGIGAGLAGATVYVILKEEADGWQIVSRKASYANAEAAIRATVASLGRDDQGGTFVAVPARSWRPVKVTPKVETTLLLEDAS